MTDDVTETATDASGMTAGTTDAEAEMFDPWSELAADWETDQPALWKLARRLGAVLGDEEMGWKGLPTWEIRLRVQGIQKPHVRVVLEEMERRGIVVSRPVKYNGVTGTRWWLAELPGEVPCHHPLCHLSG